MLEQLFGSKTRVRLLRLFLNNQNQPYFVREMTRRIGAQINAVRNELGNLVEMELIREVSNDDSDALQKNRKRTAKHRKYYELNTESLLYPELRALFLKARVLLEKDFVKRLTKSGTISYLALTGHFVGEVTAPTDLFIVGRVNRAKLTDTIKKFESDIGREVNYTVMTPQEYKYRRDVTDKFLYSILESRKIVLLDTVSEKIGAIPS